MMMKKMLMIFFGKVFQQGGGGDGVEGSNDEYDFRAKDISEGGDDMTF